MHPLIEFLLQNRGVVPRHVASHDRHDDPDGQVWYSNHANSRNWGGVDSTARHMQLIAGTALRPKDASSTC